MTATDLISDGKNLLVVGWSAAPITSKAGDPPKPVQRITFESAVIDVEGWGGVVG